MCMRWCTLLMMMVSLASPARAQAPALLLDYEAYLAGFNMMAIEAGLSLQADSYDLGLHARTKGMIGTFVHGESRTRVDGTFHGDSVLPRRYVSGGLWRGDTRRTEIEYRAGQPVIRALVPANDAEREPVPEQLQHDTVDALSAIVRLLHQVMQTGACHGETTTFDGRRVTTVSARTVGAEMLPPESRSSFQGQALHCQIAGRQIAGFPRDAGPDDYVRRPQIADVWFAPVLPGQPPLPVLMSFDTRFLGHMTIYPTHAAIGADLREYNPD